MRIAIIGIRLFFGIIPPVASILGLPLLIWYPINKASHADLRAKLMSSDGQRAAQV